LGEEEARKRGNTVGIRDQAMDIAKLNGYSVSRAEMNVLPTPMSRDYKGDTSPHVRDGKVQTDTVERAIFHSGEVLLGTPRTSSANASTSKQVQAGAPKSRIEDQVQLFPTLRASDGYERRNQKTMDKIAKEGGDMTMPTLARTTADWGRFEPAIRRWEEILGRPAPAPTKPDGKEGAHRLSSAFTEWMMGVPEGWITGVGLTRNEELKACGNGVVPQQAELALKRLLEGISEGQGSDLPMLPTATPSDAYIGNLSSKQRKPGSMHSVNLAVAVDGIQKGEMQ
jgi:DNA (cytosine-5)-methyltransferase 1